jgi:transmembrane sensor
MRADHDESEADYTRLTRYLAGESTPAEAADTEAWIAAEPRRRELMATLSTAWETAGRPRGHGGQSADVDAAWRRMSARVDRADAPSSISWSSPVLRIAAVIVVAAGGYGVWRAASPDTAVPPEVLPQPRIIATTHGERRTVMLDDSTEVVVGPLSRVIVTAEYGIDSRDVALEGEALFRVRHDDRRPFRVATAGTTIEDLGTEFTVRAYGLTDTVRVLVTSGVVLLRRAPPAPATTPPESLAVVRAGEIGLVPGTGAAIVSTATNGESLLAWSRGKLVFDDAPMRLVAEELERWYDVDVAVDSALASRPLTVEFSGEGIDDVLRVISATVGARLERRGRTVVFRPGGGPK